MKKKNLPELKTMTTGYFIKNAIYGTVGWIGLSFLFLIIFFPIGIIMMLFIPVVPFVAPFAQLKKENKKIRQQHKDELIMRFLEHQASK